MQYTSVYAYLNIEDPFCAWATYRGVLVPSPDVNGFVSVWLAGLLKSQNQNRLSVENKLESVRNQNYTSCVSRLQGMFCFMDKESAKQAAHSWGANDSNHFSASNLAELGISNTTDRLEQFDANWITWAHSNPNQSLKDDSWINKYWSGQPYPEGEPIWETLYLGRLNVLGTELREKAYERIKIEFPKSLAFLEVSRISAFLGSNLGSISRFISNAPDEPRLIYHMDMQDAENPIYLQKVEEFMESEQPVNYDDLLPHLNGHSFGHVPDFRPYGYTWQNKRKIESLRYGWRYG